jgi:hypothetical protein
LIAPALVIPPEKVVSATEIELIVLLLVNGKGPV